MVEMITDCKSQTWKLCLFWQTRWTRHTRDLAHTTSRAGSHHQISKTRRYQRVFEQGHRAAPAWCSGRVYCPIKRWIALGIDRVGTLLVITWTLADLKQNQSPREIPKYVYFNFTLGNSHPWWLWTLFQSFNLTFVRSRSDHFLHNFTLGDSSHVRCYVVRKNQEYFSPKKFNLFSSDLVLYVPCFVCALHKTNVLAVTVSLI